MQTDKTEPDKKQKASGIVFMFFPSFCLGLPTCGGDHCAISARALANGR
jgi:hypothetical protein